MYSKIEDLYLSVGDLILEPSTETKTTGHIWIYDRSWSMYRVLSGLINDLIRFSNTLNVGDTLSVGWFSGEGDFRFILMGFPITGSDSLESITAVLAGAGAARNTTCFSEILSAAVQVIYETSSLCDQFALMFLTDGYPVVKYYDKEIEAIFEILEILKGKFSSILFVGYGDYYNRDLMIAMRAITGGKLIHSSGMSTFSTEMSEFVKSASVGKRKVMVTAPYDSIMRIIAVSDTGITVPTGDSGTFMIEDSLCRPVVLTDKKPLGKACPVEDLERYVYAMASRTAQTDPDIAAKLMSALGDKYLLDAIQNAWTNQEYGSAASKIDRAVFNEHYRYINGKDTSHQTDRTSTSILDIISVLSQDEEARFYPYHDSFKYKRIGAPSITRNGYPKFSSTQTRGVPLSSIVWHSERMNLSIRAKIHGSIPLSEDHDSYGLSETFRTHVYRTYTIIKDGNLNVDVLPVSMSEESYRDLGLEPRFGEYNEGEIYPLELRQWPILNLADAEIDMGIDTLCNHVLEKTWMSGQLKALKWLRGEIEPDRKLESDTLTDEQIEYLDGMGIGRNGFSPPTDKPESVDYYYANTLKIYVRSYTSFPSVQSVIDRAKSGKGQTKAGDWVLDGLQDYDSQVDSWVSDKLKLAVLDENIAAKKKAILRHSTEINRAKFAILLAKKWFPGISRADEEYGYSGETIVFKVGKKRISF